jgi:hypothetical protein
MLPKLLNRSATSESNLTARVSKSKSTQTARSAKSSPEPYSQSFWQNNTTQGNSANAGMLSGQAGSSTINSAPTAAVDGSNSTADKSVSRNTQSALAANLDSPLNLNIDLSGLQSDILTLMQPESPMYVVSDSAKTNSNKGKDLVNPEIIQNFEAKASQILIPFQQSINQQASQLNKDPYDFWQGETVKLNNQDLFMVKDTTDTDFFAHTAKKDGVDYKKEWDRRFSFFNINQAESARADIQSIEKARAKGKPSPALKAQETFKYIEEMSPIVPTVYDQAGVKPVRRLTMNFINPEQPNEMINAQYNGGKWLCGNSNCVRGLEINVYKFDPATGKIAQKPHKTLRAHDPDQDKYPSKLKRMLGAKLLPAPPSLAVSTAA